MPRRSRAPTTQPRDRSRTSGRPRTPPPTPSSASCARPRTPAPGGSRSSAPPSAASEIASRSSAWNTGSPKAPASPTRSPASSQANAPPPKPRNPPCAASTGTRSPTMPAPSSSAPSRRGTCGHSRFVSSYSRRGIPSPAPPFSQTSSPGSRTASPPQRRLPAVPLIPRPAVSHGPNRSASASGRIFSHERRSNSPNSTSVGRLLHPQKRERQD